MSFSHNTLCGSVFQNSNICPTFPVAVQCAQTNDAEILQNERLRK